MICLLTGVKIVKIFLVNGTIHLRIVIAIGITQMSNIRIKLFIGILEGQVMDLIIKTQFIIGWHFNKIQPNRIFYPKYSSKQYHHCRNNKNFYFLNGNISDAYLNVNYTKIVDRKKLTKYKASQKQTPSHNYFRLTIVPYRL